MNVTPDAYPARLTIENPGPDRERLSAFFRIIFIIPIGIVASLLSSPIWNENDCGERWNTAFSGGGIVFLSLILMIVFRQKYPRWWFDWNRELTRFLTRLCSYFLLLRDEYPSTDDEQAVKLELDYPDVKSDLNQFLPLVKWFLAIPHFLVLWLLWIGVLFASVIAWFAILLNGSYPNDLHSYTVGVMRWSLRAEAYALLLTTDKYPPFKLGE